jgi:hypothetical protein
LVLEANPNPDITFDSGFFRVEQVPFRADSSPGDHCDQHEPRILSWDESFKLHQVQFSGREREKNSGNAERSSMAWNKLNRRKFVHYS